MRWSAHISWLFAELPYLERPAAARREGFGVVESAWPEDEADREVLPDAVAAAGVDVALLNAPAGDVAAGERGFVNDPGRRAEAEAGFISAVELAVAVGAPLVNVLVGRARLDLPAARQRAAVVTALRSFAAIATGAGVAIVLEPINAIDSPGFLVPTAQAAARLIDEVGEERIGLLLDTYHVVRAGEDPLAAVRDHRSLIRHLQVSESPGRGVPGSGSLDLDALLAAFEAVGYDGAVGLEFDPRGPTPAALAFLREPGAAAGSLQAAPRAAPSRARSASALVNDAPASSTSSSPSAVHNPNSPPVP